MAITVSNTPLKSVKSTRENTLVINGTTTLTHPLSDAGGSYTQWQIRRSKDRVTVFDFKVNNNGKINKKPQIILTSDRNSIRIKLDRQYNYEARIKANGGSWSAWDTVDLSGDLRIIGPRHRDDYTTRKSAKGSTITSNKDKFTITKTGRGVSVVTNYANYRAKRTLLIPRKLSTTGK